MKKTLLLTAALAFSANIFAQSGKTAADYKFLHHLDASITLGTTGLGFDLATPAGEYVELRAGYAFMPRLHFNMGFGVQVGETRDRKQFKQLADMLYDLTGYEANDEITMIGIPTWNNFKFLVDIYPFKDDRRWHFTAGVYIGSSEFAKAYNRTEDMPTLLAVGIYNQLYDKALNYEPLMSYGDLQLDDPELQDKLHDKFQSWGRMSMPVGEHKSDDTKYMMEPGHDGMVKARATTCTVKPYLGFGYGGQLIKGDDRYKVSFDCGMMFWGGTPDVYMHDGTDLSRDIKNIKGKVGDYTSLIRALKVFPVLNVRFTRTIF